MKKIIFISVFSFCCSQIKAANYPTITKQPIDQTVTVGGSVSFMIVSTAAFPITYQWQKNPNIGLYSDIPGATDSTYSILQTLQIDNGSKFRCMVSNSFGRALSNPGILFVNPVISTQTTTVYVLTQDELNGIKEGVWIETIRQIANLDESFFVGIATGDWTLNASSTTFQWVPVNVDTVTGITCFISTNTAHRSWTDNFKLNLVNALLSKAWDEITFPWTHFDDVESARKATVFQ